MKRSIDCIISEVLNTETQDYTKWKWLRWNRWQDMNYLMTTSKMQNVSAVADDGISGTYYNDAELIIYKKG